MKKTFKKFVSLLLIAMFMFALAVPAFACGGTHDHPDYPGYRKTKTTPYGTMTGGIHFYISDPHNFEITACTSIDSKYTMAQVTVKMECIDNNTGKSLEADSKNAPEETAYNTNFICSSHDHYYENGPIAVFTTHEVTYTTSYVLYMSGRTDGDWIQF